MPLSKTGKKIKKNFIEEYGKEKGEKIFYAWENKTKRKDIKLPSPRKAIEMGISLGALGLGIGILNKYGGS